MKKRLTPKERVLRKWPNAHADRGRVLSFHPFWQSRVWTDQLNEELLGIGLNARAAWADAARRFK